MKYLLVIDVQNDLVDGPLGTAEAVAMLPVVQVLHLKSITQH